MDAQQATMIAAEPAPFARAGAVSERMNVTVHPYENVAAIAASAAR